MPLQILHLFNPLFMIANTMDGLEVWKSWHHVLYAIAHFDKIKHVSQRAVIVPGVREGIIFSHEWPQ